MELSWRCWGSARAGHATSVEQNTLCNTDLDSHKYILLNYSLFFIPSQVIEARLSFWSECITVTHFASWSVIIQKKGQKLTSSAQNTKSIFSWVRACRDKQSYEWFGVWYAKRDISTARLDSQTRSDCAVIKDISIACRITWKTEKTPFQNSHAEMKNK